MDIDNFSTNLRALFASTSGTLNISGGAINGGHGRGVDIDGTNLNVTLTSVTSIGGSTAGIDLNSTTGTFTITGSGTAASGGTISNKTGGDGSTNGKGVLLNSATGVSLSRMQFNDFTNFAIPGSNVAGFDLLNSVIDGTNWTSATQDEDSVSITNLTGTSNFTDNTINGGLEDNLHVVNTSGTLNRLTISGGTIGLNSTLLGNDGVFAESQGSATMNVSECTFDVIVSCFAVNHARIDARQPRRRGSNKNEIKIRGTFDPGSAIDLAVDDVTYTLDDGHGRQFVITIPAGSFEAVDHPGEREFEFHSRVDGVTTKAKFDFIECKFDLDVKGVEGSNDIIGTLLTFRLEVGSEVGEDLLLVREERSRLAFRHWPEVRCCADASDDDSDSDTDSDSDDD